MSACAWWRHIWRGLEIMHRLLRIQCMRFIKLKWRGVSSLLSSVADCRSIAHSTSSDSTFEWFLERISSVVQWNLSGFYLVRWFWCSYNAYHATKFQAIGIQANYVHCLNNSANVGKKSKNSEYYLMKIAVPKTNTWCCWHCLHASEHGLIGSKFEIGQFDEDSWTMQNSW